MNADASTAAQNCARTPAYSSRWERLRLHHQTAADRTLPHQAIFVVRANIHTGISCNCLVTQERGGGKPNVGWMGPCNDLAAARQLYNDPRNHAFPFKAVTDRARW